MSATILTLKKIVNLFILKASKIVKVIAGHRILSSQYLKGHFKITVNEVEIE